MTAISDGVQFPPEPDGDLKESVAAHQATCGCHVQFGGCMDMDLPCDLQDAGTFGHDSSGQPWHLDLLCKARPEAMS